MFLYVDIFDIEDVIDVFVIGTHKDINKDIEIFNKVELLKMYLETNNPCKKNINYFIKSTFLGDYFLENTSFDIADKEISELSENKLCKHITIKNVIDTENLIIFACIKLNDENIKWIADFK